MLELAALGLLLDEPLHGYRLKQQLELFMGSCISVNYGTIYPLLKRLEKAGAIAVLSEEPGEAGCSRKIYSMTETGKQIWRQKMLEHPQESWVNARSRFLIKCFFFKHLESEERVRLMQHRLRVCQLREERLAMEPEPKDAYQETVWQWANQILSSEIQWLQVQLQAEQMRVNPAEGISSRCNRLK